MREMKDSNYGYLGIVPQSWKVDKIKYHLKALGMRNPGNAQVLSVYREYGVIPKDSRDDNHNVTSEDTSNYRYVRKGDFVINKMKAWQGSMAVSRYTGIVSPAYYVYKFTDDALNRGYFHYLLRSKLYAAEFARISGGIRVGQWDLSAYNFENTMLLIPPLEEQGKIATFLDSQCSEIDAISADIQKEIETLEQYKRSVITEAVTKGLNPDAKTKKSTIFYMAPYNFEWRLSKIGYECTKLARPFSPADTPLLCTNKGKVSPRPSDMTGKMVSEDNAMQGIHKGDIAIHGMDTWHGAIAMSEYDGKITRVVHVCDSKQDKRFIVYYLQQLAFNDVYKLISFGIRGNTSDFRSWDKVKDIYIALPDIDEQQKISDFLDLECRRVEDIVSEKKKQLDVLDAYKKSLIYEYVTGKKEVPLWNPNT